MSFCVTQEVEKKFDHFDAIIHYSVNVKSWTDSNNRIPVENNEVVKPQEK